MHWSLERPDLSKPSSSDYRILLDDDLNEIGRVEFENQNGPFVPFVWGIEAPALPSLPEALRWIERQVNCAT